MKVIAFLLGLIFALAALSLPFAAAYLHAEGPEWMRPQCGGLGVCTTARCWHASTAIVLTTVFAFFGLGGLSALCFGEAADIPTKPAT